MEQKENEECRETKGIFRQQSIDRVLSPNQLNDYIRVYNPSVWVILCAVVLLLAGIFVWSYFGRLPTVVTQTGYSSGGNMTLYIGDAGEVAPGNDVNIGQFSGTVTAVSKKPLSREEVAKSYGSDYLLHLLNVGEWNYRVDISAPELPDGTWEATIITGTVHPSIFIFN